LFDILNRLGVTQSRVSQTDGRTDVLLANAALYYDSRLCIVFLVGSRVTAFDAACVWFAYRALAASADEGSPVSFPTTSSTFCAAANVGRISSWTVRDVAGFVSLIPGCGRYAEVRHRFVFSERELTFTLAICHRPSVCRLSPVCNVRAPFSGEWNFQQCFYRSTPFGTL